MTESYQDDVTPNEDQGPHVEVVHRFAQIPESLLYDPEMPDAAVRVYGVLLRHGQDPVNCYPSYRRIGELIGRAPRSVPAWIRRLEGAGWIERVPRMTDVGDFTSNAYRVFAVADPSAAERALRAHERGGLRAEERAPYALGDAPKESHENESQSERERDNPALFDAPPSAPPDPLAGFEDWWSTYPRKTAKGAARKAWPKAVKAAGGIDQLMAAVSAFAKSRAGADPTFTPHASTWLNQERWLDEPQAAPPPKAIHQIDADRGGPTGRIDL